MKPWIIPHSLSHRSNLKKLPCPFLNYLMSYFSITLALISQLSVYLLRCLIGIYRSSSFISSSISFYSSSSYIWSKSDSFYLYIYFIGPQTNSEQISSQNFSSSKLESTFTSNFSNLQVGVKTTAKVSLYYWSRTHLILIKSPFWNSVKIYFGVTELIDLTSSVSYILWLTRLTLTSLGILYPTSKVFNRIRKYV